VGDYQAGGGGAAYQDIYCLTVLGLQGQGATGRLASPEASLWLAVFSYGQPLLCVCFPLLKRTPVPVTSF
jgi:hypothetical protein